MRLKLLSHSANDLFWFILPLVLPFLLTKYSLSYTQAGGILTVYLLVTAAGSFLMGKLSDRFSPKRILGFGFILASLGLAVSGFAPSLALFLLIISLTAVGVSTFHPVMYAIIDRNYPENKGRVMGLYESFGTGAILLMYLVNGLLFQWIGIRGVLMITALPAMIAGLVFLASSDPAYSIAVKAASAAAPARTDRKALVRFLWFLVSIILRVMSVTAIVNFLPTLFVRHFGFAESSAAYGAAFFFAGGIAGSLFAGKISERFNPFGILAVGSCLIALSILAFNLDLPKLAYPLLVAVFGFVGSGCIISQNLLMTKLGGSLGRGEIFGILMGVMTVTSAFSPALFGMAIDLAGFNAAFLAFSLPVAVSMGILAYLRKSATPAAALPPLA
jgi:MFS transporter, FSR family, fosmidomycin resistance protein